jgi:hypothetical protein
MTAIQSPAFRLIRGSRIVTQTDGSDLVVAEFPATSHPDLNALRSEFGRVCLAALSAAFSPEGPEASQAAPPLELFGLALRAIEEADVAFAVINISDGLTPQARRTLGDAWVLVQETIGARRGCDSDYVQAARENRAALRIALADHVLDRYEAALSSGASAREARDAALASAAAPP